MSDALAAKIMALRIEHRTLDNAIVAISNADHIDQLQIKRLKKRKLGIKDLITKIESRLIPDIDA